MGTDPPLDEEEFRRWREDADQALLSARVQAKERLYNWSCFSAEQASQLAVKALLHGLGRGPSGHDLVRHAEMIGEGGIDVPGEIADAMGRLARHYIPTRYPNSHPSGSASEHYTDADTADAIADAEGIIEFVDRTWQSAQNA